MLSFYSMHFRVNAAFMRKHTTAIFSDPSSIFFTVFKGNFEEFPLSINWAYFSSLAGVSSNILPDLLFCIQDYQLGVQGGVVGPPRGAKERIPWKMLLVWLPNMLKQPVFGLKACLKIVFKNSLKIEFFLLFKGGHLVLGSAPHCFSFHFLDFSSPHSCTYPTNIWLLKVSNRTLVKYV